MNKSETNVAIYNQDPVRDTHPSKPTKVLLGKGYLGHDLYEQFKKQKLLSKDAPECNKLVGWGDRDRS